ncbi:movement protein [Alphacytorhabdovirus ribes]|nr:movement protein [Black currant cytorhabdovirus 1]
MLNVNEVRRDIKKLGSLTAAVSTGTVYDGKYNRYARKRELNIIITSTGHPDFLIRQVPLFDKQDLDILRADSEVNKYLHIGCITISIEPLLHQKFMKNHGDKISGYCAIVDSTFRNLSESIVSLHSYELHKGRADFVCYPNHCLSLTDPHLSRRLSVLIGISGIDVDPGVELFSLCIGYIITGVNTLHPTSGKGISSLAITGTSDMEYSEISPRGVQALEGSYNDVKIINLPSDEDVYLKSKGSLLSNLIHGRKDIKRRTMRLVSSKTPEIDEETLSESSSRSRDPPELVRVPLGLDAVYEVAKNITLQKKLNEINRSKSMKSIPDPF